MPNEESRDGAVAEPARSERPHEGEKKKKAKRPKLPLPRTEREIDAPDRVTLVMLGVMCLMTIVLWAFARGGCNYHPPRETRRPRALKIEELARDPKDAAIELQQRLVQMDFDGALALSADSAEADVKKQKADCAGKVAQCAETKKKRERAATTAALLERDMGSATVRATSVISPSEKQANILKLERRGPIWKVVSFARDDGSYKPQVPVAMEITQPTGSGTPTPPPSGSAVVPEFIKIPVTEVPTPAASAKP